MTEAASVRDQILQGTVEAATVHGITKLSMRDVARQVGLSRQTLYRHFPSKDALIAEVVVTETNTLIAKVVAAGQVHDDPRDALEAGLLAALRATREHPLLDRLVRTEPEALLPLLTTDGGPVMTQVRSVVEMIMTERMPGLEGLPLRRLADIVTRLLISYAVSAPDDPPEEVAAFVATFLTHGAVGEVLP
jgi:AcrR family transcriptional regulator